MDMQTHRRARCLTAFTQPVKNGFSASPAIRKRWPKGGTTLLNALTLEIQSSVARPQEYIKHTIFATIHLRSGLIILMMAWTSKGPKATSHGATHAAVQLVVAGYRASCSSTIAQKLRQTCSKLERGASPSMSFLSSTYLAILGLYNPSSWRKHNHQIRHPRKMLSNKWQILKIQEP